MTPAEQRSASQRNLDLISEAIRLKVAARQAEWDAITDPKQRAEAVARMRYETDDHGMYCYCHPCRIVYETDHGVDKASGTSC